MRAIYRAFLLLYPRAFRRRYGAELLAAFDAERRDPRFDTRFGCLRFCAYLAADLFAAAGRQRYRQVRLTYFQLTGRGTPHLPVPSRRGFMETIIQDIRYAVRQFARRPGFTAIAVLSLTLGIGGNSIIYGLLDGFVFNPFRYPEPDRLVALGVTFPRLSGDTTYIEALSPAEYSDIKSLKSFSSIAAFDVGNRNVSGGDSPERLFTAFLLDDLFSVVGMQPLLGRGFTPQELIPRGPRVAIISHRVWQSRFGADPRILERTIRIGGESTTIVGVMPPELVLLGTDLWIPWGGDTTAVPRNVRQFTILGRLAPGVTREAANAELALLSAQTQQMHTQTFKEYEGWRITATPWSAALMQDLRPAAFVLLVAVGLVLLISCANLTNLMLARATTRSRELAVRLALGAGRLRIARQLLAESMVLAAAGAAGGVVLAYVALPFAGALIPTQFQVLGLNAGVNLRVLGWSVVAAFVAGVLVALLPMLHATRTDPHESLKSEGRASAARGTARLRHSLIVGEIALSVVLLLGAGLLMRSFLNLQRADLGFEPKGVLTMRLTLPAEKYSSEEAVTAFFEELTRRIDAIAGVEGAAMASQFPPGFISSAQIEVEGVEHVGSTLPTANVTITSKDYFRTIGVPLRRGRFFSSSDTPDTPPRVVINEAFVARFMKERDPLSTRFRVLGRGGPGPWNDVVGVVGDAKNAGLAAPIRPEVFVPMEQMRDGWNQLFLLVRTSGEPSAFLPQVRSVVASLDPEQPIYAIQTMEEAVSTSVFQQRISAGLIAVFAVVAMIMSAIGIYGVMSYAVSARTQEIGIRMAIGAERSDVLRLVLAQVARMTVVGLAIGVALLLFAGQALRDLLYGVNPSDPATIAVVTILLGTVALLAGWIPAYRASKVNPIVALRYE